MNVRIKQLSFPPSEEDHHGEKHITRIMGQDKDGPVPDVWIDVERRDQYKILFEGEEGSSWELYVFLKWSDDPENQKENNREVETIKIFSADEEDYKNPSVWVELDIILSMMVVDDDYEMERTIKIDYKNEGREIEVRQVPHRDTNVDKDAEKKFEQVKNETDRHKRVFVVDREDYKQDKESTDEEQFAEVEFIKSSSNLISQPEGSDGTDIELLTTFKNEEWTEDFKEAKKEKTGEDGINPPYRLDPFQNIVNVMFGGLAVHFGHGALGTLHEDAAPAPSLVSLGKGSSR